MFLSSKNSVMKSMGIGFVVGMAAVAAGAKMMGRSSKRACRKRAAKCMKTVEGMLNSFSAMAK